jgi:GAF domain-containing protein
VGWTPPQNAASRYHRGWTGTGRSELIRHLVVTIDRYEDLRSLAHGAAAAVAELMAATTAHVTLIVEDQFYDLVNVGELPPGQVTFPKGQFYPMSAYPAAAERLLTHRGYLSTDQLEVVTEYIEQLPYEVPDCFMAAPIVAQGRVLGEIFLTRGPGEPTFTHEDLDLVIDLATVVGSRIPAVIGDESIDAVLR